MIARPPTGAGCRAIGCPALRRRLRAVAFGALLAAAAATSIAAPASAPDVQIIDRTERYTVRGSTARALESQLRALGPVGTTGRRVWGLTRWLVRAQYGAVSVDGGCRVDGPRAIVEFTTILPQWQNTGGANRGLRGQWSKMLARLVEHEGTHRGHGVDAARRVATELQAMPLQVNCAAVDREVRSILRRAVSHSRQLSLAYDRETDFGKLEGVQLEGEPAGRFFD